MPTPRQLAREQMMRDIVRVGGEHLATGPPGDLSLRAVARDLGVVPSAIYRYVRDRDALLTLLIVDAYDDLGAEVEAAVAAASRRGPRARSLVACQAFRTWSLREPSRFALLFGTPVPGYAAPADRTVEPGTRVPGVLLGLLEEAWLAGDLTPPDGSLPRSVRRDMEGVRREFGLTVPAPALAKGVGLWSALVGAVSFEVFHQYGPDTLTEPDTFFDLHLTALIDALGY
ncbi:TetR/AcrR family transcriptional regulator [Aeromicrobium sp. CF4.19]|uniref:TetR/AcrR family transcriptional regulator n=1 Tax=Aeromicrobium sp. CF4.19 TaxID=3373082 RepID=UPI003EE78A28